MGIGKGVILEPIMESIGTGNGFIFYIPVINNWFRKETFPRFIPLLE